MDPALILTHSVWTAGVAAGLGVTLTAPARNLLACAACGFIGRCVKDIAMASDLDLIRATVLAALVVVLVAAALTRRQAVSPVVLICGALPLGASSAMFGLIFALMQVSTAEGAELAEASLSLTSNLGKVFATSLAIAVGMGAGVAIVRLIRRGDGKSVSV
ncbi:threonine/serine exporter family protein [Brevundimonas sp. Root1279]|uniref:threonine/serine exporter family protein n=1 Tax=Brevundimonas sp. Root1279 TaxID=1736443 RepID=UPI0006FCA589|nr:threonine/serine exporter family protein [Brevundimonas sp. Root1279]KQW86728.1 hypothetical protein ASC65_02250 [Brevundimonas sp. Root1279]